MNIRPYDVECGSRDFDCVALVEDVWEVIEGPEESRVSRFLLWSGLVIFMLTRVTLLLRYITPLQSPHRAFCW